MDPASKLQMERLDGTGGTLVRMRGAIDADLPTAELTRNVGAAFVVDLGGVERVTSFGVREWSRMLDRIQTGWIGFMNCRPIVVVQFNTVADFGKHGQIVSLYLPYVCDACGEECEDLVDLRERFDVVEAGEPPTMKCPKCGEDAAFDDLPENYFSFVRAQGRPRVPEGAARIIAGKLDGAGAPFHVDKEVDGDLTALWLSGTLDGRARMKRVLDGVQGNAVVELGGLTAVDVDGATRLSEMLRAQEFRPFLARVPSSVLVPLFVNGRTPLSGTLVSLVVDGACPRCQSLVRVDVPAADLGKRTWTRICDRCFAERRLNAAPVLAELAASVRAAEVPADVADYLESHPFGHRPADKTRSSPPGAPALQPAALPRSTTSTSGSYEIMQPLGKGGMAEVFLARKKGIEGFEKRVVLKRMRPNLAPRDDFAKMFLQEARTAARINHPNVVQIYDLGLDDGEYFIAMEYVEGWDLAVVARAVRKLGKKIPVAIACRLVADLCAGLHAAHTARDESGVIAPIVHRDVSPHNLLVSTEGSVKLTDFGISKSVDSGQKTQAGVVKGKVPYMAPEQLDGQIGVVDHRVDVYQAGVVLAELIVGYSPFSLENDTKSLVGVLMNKLPDFARERPDCPPLVVEITRKALALKPEHRYQTAREMQTELESAIVLVLQRAVGADAVATWLAELAAEAVPAGALRPSGFTTPAVEGAIEDIDVSDLNKTVVVNGGAKP